MKPSNKHTAQWLAGTSILAATSTSAHAATVMIDFADHDLTTTLTGASIFNGVSDAGQLLSVYNFTGASYRSMILQINRVDGNTSNRQSVYAANAYYAVGVGSYDIGVQQSAFASSGTARASGLVAWDLSNGTKGWLHINGTSSSGEFSMIADYFVFDDANDQVRPDHGGDSEAFASVATTTLNAQAAPVPEPSSLALLALGAAGVMTRRRRSLN